MHIHTDSQYSLHSISKFCRMRLEEFTEAIPFDKVLNLDIISDIVELIRQKLPNKVFISKVAGHRGIIGNEIADKLSKQARLAIITEEARNLENRRTAVMSLQRFLWFR